MDEPTHEVPDGFIETLKDSSDIQLAMLRHELKRFPCDQKFLRAVDEQIKQRALAKANK